MECMILRGDQWERVKVAYEDSLNIESNNTIQNDMRYRRSEMYVCKCISIALRYHDAFMLRSTFRYWYILVFLLYNSLYSESHSNVMSM